MNASTVQRATRLARLVALSVLLSWVGLFLPSCADRFFTVDGGLTTTA